MSQPFRESDVMEYPEGNLQNQTWSELALVAQQGGSEELTMTTV